MATLERINPILCVRDVSDSIAYYTTRLGFTDGFLWGDPATFGSVTRDGLEVMFCQDGQGNPGTWLTIWVDDVDDLFTEFASSGADIRQEPIDLPWGVREMNVADPDGHRIRFSTETGRQAADVTAPFGLP
jgi:uncharacterized glyoxalase superfamily protein PhnB